MSPRRFAIHVWGLYGLCQSWWQHVALVWRQVPTELTHTDSTLLQHTSLTVLKWPTPIVPTLFQRTSLTRHLASEACRVETIICGLVSRCSCSWRQQGAAELLAPLPARSWWLPRGGVGHSAARVTGPPSAAKKISLNQIIHIDSVNEPHHGVSWTTSW